jgi:ABC-type multidrug transport system fused ATPase/permease subunit
MTVREVIRASLHLLDRRDRRLLGLSVAAQMATSLLDLFGVVLVGALSALAVTVVEVKAPPPRVATVVSVLGLGSLPESSLVAVLACAASVLLLAKSVVSPLLMAWVLRFLARREVVVSARLARELLSRPLTFVQQRSSQETAAAILRGVNAATVVVLGQMVVAAAETVLLVVLALALLVVNPVLALGAIAFFLLVGMGLQRVLGRWATRSGGQRMRAEVASLRAVQEALGAYREITVADRRSFYVDRVRGLSGQASRAAADLELINILPKYVFEAALVLGAFALAGVLFSTQSIGGAAGTFALFLAAATRGMPSLIRLQTAALAMRGAAGSAVITFALVRDLGDPVGESPLVQPDQTVRQVLRTGHPGLVPGVVLHEVAFTYPGADVPAIRGINMVVDAGRSVALIGRSGAGKSTLADVILGILEPDEGELSVGGLPPCDAVRRWPGGIAYVPQDVMLVDDSVRANVALGLPGDVIDDDLVWDALRRAHLADDLRRLPDELDTQIGERGLRLSGGQRQRLGIARAMFTRPRLLVLDEATSSLDAETEHAITEMLGELKEDVTTVIIAHRLSTIRHVDHIVYLEDGKALAQGTFDEVCVRIPALQRQVALMGLRPS